jgi:hypothetical protein
MIDTKTNRSQLYETLTKKDVITKLMPLLKKNFRIRVDGKLTSSLTEPALQWDTPWLHQYQTGEQDCHLWHRLFFVNTGLTPTKCKSCWKVVVIPRTVVELFDLYEVQKQLEHPCKCGLELRATDERNYGGYFYNIGKQEGLACYQKVRQAVDEQISPEVTVALKCACTEFELKNGPPDDYEASQEQLELEQTYSEYVTTNDLKFNAPEYMHAHQLLSFIHRAAKIGDLSYKEFTDGKSLVRQPVTYHDEIEEIENG